MEFISDTDAYRPTVVRYGLVDGSGERIVCYFPESCIAVVRDGRDDYKVLFGGEHELERRRGRFISELFENGNEVREIVLNQVRISILPEAVTDLKNLRVLKEGGDIGSLFEKIFLS